MYFSFFKLKKWEAKPEERMLPLPAFRDSGCFWRRITS